jgi:hypothetical protein
VIVASAWTDFEALDDVDQAGWRQHAPDRAAVIWDDATETVVVVVDDSHYTDELLRFHASRERIRREVGGAA